MVAVATVVQRACTHQHSACQSLSHSRTPRTCSCRTQGYTLWIRDMLSVRPISNEHFRIIHGHEGRTGCLDEKEGSKTN